MLVTLTRVSASFFEGHGLRLFFDVITAESKPKLFAFRLPTADDPCPPGWASIERLTRVTAAEVIASWVGEQNACAESLSLDLSARYSGQRFFVTPIAHDPVAVELAHLNTEIETSRRVTRAAPPPPVEPVRYAYPTRVRFEQTSLAEPTQLVIEFEGANELRIRVPDGADQTPTHWWFVETFTGIAHERIVQGWERGGNRVLEDAVRLLGDAIRGQPAPVVGAEVDLDGWRRTLVQVRLSQGIKPFVFLGRPDHNGERTRALLTDAAGTYLFRSNVEPGESRGVPSLIIDSDGKTTVQHLDTQDVMRGVLNRYIRFAASGRPPKPRNPPKELIADLITFPDRQWPIIKGIVRIPTVREDGSVISRPGYDETTRLWYAPEFEFEPVPESPTDADIARAKALITTPFSEFPFAHEGGLAGTLAALFEQLVRPMIRGPRPLYIFDAPEQGQGSGKCTVITSTCVTSRGLLSLAELAPGELPSDTAHEYEATVAPRVLTVDNSMQSVSHFYSGGIKPTRKLRTWRGFELEGTLVHPVRVATSNGPAWKKLEEIRPGDYVAICVARHPGAATDLIDADLAWLLGALTADGSLNAYDYTHGGLSYTKDDTVLRTRVASLAARYLEAEVVEEANSHGNMHLRFNNAKRVREHMETYGLSQTTAALKQIPYTVRASSSRVWASFLCGLFDGDASVLKSSFEWTTASEDLCKQVQIMLAALGVWSTRKPKPVQLKNWDSPRTYWRLTFSGDDLDAYADVVGFTHEDKARWLFELAEDDRVRNTNLDVVPCAGDLIREVYRATTRSEAERNAWKREMAGKNNPSRARLRRFVEATPVNGDASVWTKLLDMTAGHVRWDRVEEIEESEAEVADLSVPNGHSFVANGFQVHNTLLAKTIQAIIAGYDEPFISALGKREDEIEKRITTLLRQQHPVLICDNLTTSIVSESLQQLATSERWQARLLNTNDAPIYPQTATWILTLNAAKMNRDIARRSVLVQLDTKMDRAYERTGFKIEDLYSWVRDRRANIIRACLVLVRSWVSAGCPRDPDVVRGSFEGWCRVIGGLLRHAGFGGLARALRATSERDTMAEDHHLLLGLWAHEYGVGRSLTASTLGEMAAHAGLYADRLKKGAGALALGREMSRILRNQVMGPGRTWGGYRVVGSQTLLNGYNTYTLLSAENPQQEAQVVPLPFLAGS